MPTRTRRGTQVLAGGCLGLLLASAVTLLQGCSSHSRGLGSISTAGAPGGIAGGGATGARGAVVLGGTVAGGGTTATTTSSVAASPRSVLLVRGPGNFGFAPPQDRFLNARIEADALTGELMLTGSIHRKPDGGPSKDEPVGPIALSDDQVLQLRARIAALPPATCLPPPVNLPCDDSLLTTITIDGNEYAYSMCRNSVCTGYGSAVQALADLIDSMGNQAAATAALDAGRGRAEAGSVDSASPPDAGGPDLNPDASRDAPIPGPDSSRNFPAAFEGIWLFGWSGGLNHYSWIRFSALSTTATDPSSPGDGTVDILAGQDAVPSNSPFWPCSGRGRWFITQMPVTISIEPPPGCASASSEMYTIASVQDAPSSPPGCLQRVSLTRSSLLMPVEALRYPDSQCDAAMTICQPAY